MQVVTRIERGFDPKMHTRPEPDRGRKALGIRLKRHHLSALSRSRAPRRGDLRVESLSQSVWAHETPRHGTGHLNPNFPRNSPEILHPPPPSAIGLHLFNRSSRTSQRNRRGGHRVSRQLLHLHGCRSSRLPQKSRPHGARSPDQRV